MPPLPADPAARRTSAQPESTESAPVHAQEHLAPEERKEREELKDRLRKRIAYQQVVCLLAIFSYIPWRLEPSVDSYSAAQTR